MVVIAILISIIAGISIVFARIFNSKIADQMGLFQGALLNYLAGLAVSVMLTLFAKEYLIFSRELFIGIPLWAYFGGLLGIVIVVMSSYLTNKVSVFYLTLLIFIGQIIAGILIDYLVTKEIPIGKSIGGLLVVSGFLYNLKIDFQEDQITTLEDAS